MASATGNKIIPKMKHAEEDKIFFYVRILSQNPYIKNDCRV